MIDDPLLDPDYLAAIVGQPATLPADDEPPTLQSQIISLAQLRAMPEPDWLIESLLSLDSLAIVYGKRGAYKSFLAVDLLASAAVGARWHHRHVERSRGLYVVGEGTAGLAKRFDAWRAAHPQHDPELGILPNAVNLLSPAQVASFAVAAADLGARLIVFDTLARMLVGGDENSAKDAGIAVAHLDQIRRRTGACVLVVHHAGKGEANGARGSSAFEAAADTVLEVTAADGLVTLSTTKQKNALAAPPIRLQPRAEGNSIVLVDYDGAPADELPAVVLQTLQALADIEIAGGVPASQWEAATSANSNVARRSFYRHRKQLIAAGLVEVVGTEKRPRYQVKQPDSATVPSSATEVS